MNTKPERKIVVIDDIAPEANAMLQALYSRDPQSVTEHLDRVQEIGSDKFMASYYVGYGHKSIGDCGTTTLYVEQVSLLAAKALQDWPLYNGQEASTRYLDMSGQAVINPLESSDGFGVQERWMKLYTRTIQTLIPELTERFPRRENEGEKTYEKAIKAKAFDIARGLLPSGVTTLLAWHTNLRQAHDHLKRLRHHPLAEIREVAAECVEMLKNRYPNSFSHKQYSEEEQYLDKLSSFAYADRPAGSRFSYTSNIRRERLDAYKAILRSRPAKAELPHELREAGDFEFRFLLDFGSFRDLQRHRSITLPMPLLTLDYGFEPWYFEQFPESMLEEIHTTIGEQERIIRKLSGSAEQKQYYIPLGYRVACYATASIPAATYIAELRSGQTVHSTLRQVAQDIGRALKAELPEMALYVDNSDDMFSIKRGSQDIVQRRAC